MELAKIPIYQTSRGLLYFAHVPRTAGTSIENRLKKEFGSPAFLDRAWKPDRSAWHRSSPQHVPWRDFLALFPLEFFCEIFSLVREPAQRLKSVYLFQKNIKGTVPSDQSFSKWLRAATEEGFANSRIFDNHTLPMSLIVPLDAKVFRLEDGLAEFDNYLLTNFGARNSGFERANSSGKNASDEVVVSRDDLELIEVVYAEDYERFGYDTVTSKRSKRHLYSSRQKVDQRGRDLSSWEFVVQAPTPRPMNQRLWGDTHFAWALVVN